MSRIRFHDLRHSCASLLLASGVSLKDIQSWLGHSSIATTGNIYLHQAFLAKISTANALLPLLSPAEKISDTTSTWYPRHLLCYIGKTARYSVFTKVLYSQVPDKYDIC